MADPPKLPPDAREILEATRHGSVVVITGAGISAPSGIPTFRGREGYWTVGSREYHPQEMATLSAFRSMPGEVWRWYLYRLGVCRGAEPNSAHLALRELEEAIGDRFFLITQNVDGLHLRAGNSRDRTCEVHGNIELYRCPECAEMPIRLPADLPILQRETPLPDGLLDRLRCSCGTLRRPHVLWFDEYYDESLYRSSTALDRATQADLIVVIGSSGAASLPIHASLAGLEAGAAFINLDPNENVFQEMADRAEQGATIRAGAETASAMVDVLLNRT
ncbi:MAG: Sir2 family NAD-dependent protein deacetylase [Planctomycetota bacterium]